MGASVVVIQGGPYDMDFVIPEKFFVRNPRTKWVTASASIPKTLRFHNNLTYDTSFPGGWVAHRRLHACWEPKRHRDPLSFLHSVRSYGSESLDHFLLLYLRILSFEILFL